MFNQVHADHVITITWNQCMESNPALTTPTLINYMHAKRIVMYIAQNIAWVKERCGPYK